MEFQKCLFLWILIIAFYCGLKPCINKAAADEGGSQPRAAGNAAAFCFAMINQIQVESKDILSTDKQAYDLKSLDFKKELTTELVSLYPQGPEQEDIWKRAGGDVSILVNFSNRKSQWFNAIDKLALGGGGKDITLETLLNEVKDDYPNFKF